MVEGVSALEATLRRYTEISYVIDLLQTRELVLVNPKAWDGRFEECAMRALFRHLESLQLIDWRVRNVGKPQGQSALSSNESSFLKESAL
jgi:hypothetical protein